MIVRFILRALVAALGLWIAARYVHGIEAHGLESLLAAAVLLGVVNAFVRPIVIVLTLPFTLITLGLFLLVINACMLELVAMFLHGFKVHSFTAAILGSIIVSIVSWIGSWFIHSATREARS
jgi:putative membrane protein